MNIEKLLETTIREYLNEQAVQYTTQNISNKYSNKNVMYHCSDDFRYEFKLEYVKGEYRGIHGWGVYFASTPFKASDYGDYMTIVDKSNLNLLLLDYKITDEFIQEIEFNLGYGEFQNIKNEINTNDKYVSLREYSIYSISELKSLMYKLEGEVVKVKNNKEYDEINNNILNIKNLLLIENSNTINKEIFYDLKKNKGNNINDLLLYYFNHKPISYEKYVSLFFNKCGYDGFNYDDYKYVIFNTNNLRIIEHIKIR
jgi:hypothetical protein